MIKRLPALNALRTFDMVARTGSLTAAAASLHVTPSAVSHQIKRLEDDLGVSLLDRSPRHVALTPEGSAYWQEVRAAFDQLTAATEGLRRRARNNVVTVTMPPVFAIRWLVRRLPDFHQQFPDIEVRISTSYRVVDLAHGDCDLAIRWTDHMPASRLATYLMGDRVQPVCSPSYPFSAPGDRLFDLTTVRLIYMGYGTDDWHVWAAIHAMRLPPSSQGLHFNDPGGALQAATDGLGVALGPRALVDDDLATGRLVTAHPTVIKLSGGYYLVRPPRQPGTEAATAFAEWVTALCHDYESRLQPADIQLLPDAIRLGR